MPPALSVVVPRVNGSPWIEEVFDHLQAQTIGDELEILIPNRLTDERILTLVRTLPRVRVLSRPGTSTIPELRWVALQAAQAPYVAFLEDHTPPPPEWAERILALHAAGYDAVGGPVANGSSARFFDRVFYLCEYASAMPPLPDGLVETLPGNNASFRKSMIERHDELAGRWEDAWCSVVRGQGGQVFRSSSLMILHRNPLTPRSFLAQRYYYGRGYAAMRGARALWPMRVLQGFGAVVILPWLLPLRLLRTLAQRGALTPANLVALPFIWPCQLAGAWGEALGAWFGDGGALARVR